MRIGIVGGLVLALGLTAACADQSRTAGNGKICSPLAAQPAAATDPAAATAGAGGDAVALDDCLHSWGYRLARGRDGADVVARAVVAACSPVLSRWNAATLAQPQTGPDSAVSLVTGRTGNTPEDRFEGAQSKALFYVVQGRAGNCAAP